MFERILVPLDGSELSERVLPYVSALAKKFGSEVVLLQVVTPPASPFFMQGIPGTGAPVVPTAAEMSAEISREQLEDEERSAERYLRSVGRRLRRQGIHVQAEVAEGPPAQMIIECAGEAAASLVAMSTRGRGGLSRLVFGSVADEVARHCHLPVFLMRPEEGG